jgi:hypothetical protein
VVAAGASRSTGAHAGDVHLVDPIETTAQVGSQKATEPGRHGAPDDNRPVARPGHTV